jgi:hypothetical protein
VVYGQWILVGTRLEAEPAHPLLSEHLLPSLLVRPAQPLARGSRGFAVVGQATRPHSEQTLLVTSS